MSGALGGLAGGAASTLGGLLPGVSTGPGWVERLRPASFRGVPFYVDEAGYRGGRRIEVHEFPFRDAVAVEDLGRAASRFALRCYLIGDGYLDARDALERAVEQHDTAAVLVHPYRGNLTCRAGLLSGRETRLEGGWCTVDIEFVLAGAPTPAAGPGTASGLLSGLSSLLPVIAAGYGLASLVAGNPGVLAGLATTLLGQAAGAFLGLPPATLGGLTGILAAWTASPTDPVATPVAIAGSFDAAAANVAAAAAAIPVPDPIDGTLPVAAPDEYSGGIAALATWGDGVAPIAPLADYYGGPELVAGAPVLPAGVPLGYTGYTGPTSALLAPPGVTVAALQQAVSQQALVDLVEAAALYATLQVAAQTAFDTAEDADAARAQLVALLDRRIYAAAAAGATDLYRAWSAIAGMAIADLITRAQTLPRRIAYAVPASLPSVRLAQRLYADSTRADALVALNAWPHPLFMPPTGLRLSA